MLQRFVRTEQKAKKAKVEEYAKKHDPVPAHSAHCCYFLLVHPLHSRITEQKELKHYLQRVFAQISESEGFPTPMLEIVRLRVAVWQSVHLLTL